MTFAFVVNYYGKGLFGRRQREINKISMREAAKRLGPNSPTAYARYEQVKVRPPLQKYEQLLHAVNPKK